MWGTNTAIAIAKPAREEKQLLKFRKVMLMILHNPTGMSCGKKPPSIQGSYTREKTCLNEKEIHNRSEAEIAGLETFTLSGK